MKKPSPALDFLGALYGLAVRLGTLAVLSLAAAVAFKYLTTNQPMPRAAVEHMETVREVSAP